MRGVVRVGTPWVVPMAVMLRTRWRWVAASCLEVETTTALTLACVRLRRESRPLPRLLWPTAALLFETWVATALAVAPWGAAWW